MWIKINKTTIESNTVLMYKFTCDVPNIYEWLLVYKKNNDVDIDFVVDEIKYDDPVIKDKTYGAYYANKARNILQDEIEIQQKYLDKIYKAYG